MAGMLMSSEQVTALLAILDHHTLALDITAGATAITALAALCALLLAWKHVLTARSGIKATFIVELDKRWEGNEMQIARTKWLQMRTHIKQSVEQTHGSRVVLEQQAQMGEECSKYLHDLRIKNPHEYNDIMSVVGFFEMAGYWVDRKYISLDEVIDLFGEAIREIDRLCWKHIHKRIDDSKEQGAGKSRLFEHACNLIVRTRTSYRYS
jgi:hypothetical protein